MSKYHRRRALRRIAKLAEGCLTYTVHSCLERQLQPEEMCKLCQIRRLALNGIGEPNTA